MIREYIHNAMRHAHYEIIDPPETPFYGEIPELPGVLACGVTLEDCRADIEDALDGWIVLGLQLGHEIPEVDGINVNRLRAIA